MVEQFAPPTTVFRGGRAAAETSDAARTNEAEKDRQGNLLFLARRAADAKRLDSRTPVSASQNHNESRRGGGRGRSLRTFPLLIL